MTLNAMSDTVGLCLTLSDTVGLCLTLSNTVGLCQTLRDIQPRRARTHCDACRQEDLQCNVAGAVRARNTSQLFYTLYKQSFPTLQLYLAVEWSRPEDTGGKKQWLELLEKSLVHWYYWVVKK